MKLQASVHRHSIPRPFCKVIYGEFDADYLGLWFGISTKYADPVVIVEVSGNRRVDPRSRRGRALAWISEHTGGADF